MLLLKDRVTYSIRIRRRSLRCTCDLVCVKSSLTIYTGC